MNQPKGPSHTPGLLYRTTPGQPAVSPLGQFDFLRSRMCSPVPFFSGTLKVFEDREIATQWSESLQVVYQPGVNRSTCPVPVLFPCSPSVTTPPPPSPSLSGTPTNHDPAWSDYYRGPSGLFCARFFFLDHMEPLFSSYSFRVKVHRQQEMDPGQISTSKWPSGCFSLEPESKVQKWIQYVPCDSLDVLPELEMCCLHGSRIAAFSTGLLIQSRSVWNKVVPI